MTINGWVQIAFMLALILGTARPLGLFMAAVLEGRRTFLDPAIRPIETRFYALSGVDEKREQTWLGYVMALLSFSTAGFVLLYAFLRLQYYLPLNPQGFSGLSEHLAFNTDVSFVTAAIFASLLSFAAYNFFFINPVYTFTVAAARTLRTFRVSRHRRHNVGIGRPHPRAGAACRSAPAGDAAALRLHAQAVEYRQLR